MNKIVLLFLFLNSCTSCPDKKTFNYTDEEKKAYDLMTQSFAVIKEHRLKLGIPIDFHLDPAGSGLIGVESSIATSNKGLLKSKLDSVNPQWAVIVLGYFKKANLRAGDSVAVQFTGSFPALNVALRVACEVYQLKCLAIASLLSSEYGANIPGLLWPQMEEVLIQKKIISQKTLALSLGGLNDRADNLSSADKKELTSIAKKFAIPLIEFSSLNESIKKRMKLYRKWAKGQKLRAFINVGGAQVSFPDEKYKQAVPAGIFWEINLQDQQMQSLFTEFQSLKVPMIHLGKIRDLVQLHQL